MIQSFAVPGTCSHPIGRLEVTRIAYAEDDMPVETVINVFPSQQWAFLRVASRIS